MKIKYIDVIFFCTFKLFYCYIIDEQKEASDSENIFEKINDYKLLLFREKFLTMYEIGFKRCHKSR